MKFTLILILLAVSIFAIITREVTTRAGNRHNGMSCESIESKYKGPIAALSELAGYANEMRGSPAQSGILRRKFRPLIEQNGVIWARVYSADRKWGTAIFGTPIPMDFTPPIGLPFKPKASPARSPNFPTRKYTAYWKAITVGDVVYIVHLIVEEQ